ncbi:MAG: LuxR C-terminal-related transcriptional regulator [Anaerolineales bacterium]|jgi:predicted ATPase/DNA-binding CsgD family transcriptional regulator
MGNYKQSQDGFRINDLTWREQDVLNLLAEHLSNREIAERLFLAESTVKDYVRKILKKLNVKNRRQAVERASELGILSRKSNLPSGLTPFIGRTGELEEIRQQLGKTRLLTLTGPGGMGKTRLALKAAEEAAGDFRDGCFFVSLAPIRSINHIIQAIAEAVNFPLPTHEDPKYQLLRYLRKKKFLLIMDNFEHLIDGVGIVSDILQTTSDVKILATSRERLNLQNEINLSIGGMQVGDKVEVIKNKEAVALFLQSADQIRFGFDPTLGELAKIEDICTLVGGMPLAIELAASWLHVLSVNEVYDEMKKGLDILGSEVRDAPARHRSIRAVFDHSWMLLDQIEREIFMRLSIFRGGFTREAAGQVASASLKQIGGLVNKSILRHDPVTGRFEIHELLRQYAQEKLESTARARESTQEMYAAYYADFMQDKWKELRGSRQIPALTEIEMDVENVRAAWRYYLDGQNVQQLQKFVYSFWLVYLIRGWFRGGIELFADSTNILARPEGDPDLQAVRAVSMAFQGYFMSLVGLTDEGYKLIKKSIHILEQLDYPFELAIAYYTLSLTSYYLNQPDEEKGAAQRFLRLADTSNDPWLLATGFWLVGHADLSWKNYAESKRLLEASLKLNNELKNPYISVLCFTSLGVLGVYTGDFGEAKKYFSSCLQTANTLKATWLSSLAIQALGGIAVLTNELPEAREHLTQSLRSAYDLGWDRDIGNHLFEFASLRVKQKRLEEGVELISLLLQQPASHLVHAGGGLIRDRAKALLSDIEGSLSKEKYEAALQRGALMNLDEVVLELLGSKA